MTPVGDDYAQVGDVPLSTPAWITEDLSDLYGGNDWKGDGTEAAYHHGEEPSTRWWEPRAVSIPLVVVGHRDPDGAPLADARLGRADNLDALKGALANTHAGDGTLQVRHVLTGRTTRSAPCQVTRTRLGKLAPVGMRMVVDLWLPGGVMRDVDPTTATGTGSAAFDLVVPHAGTADQYDTEITLTGTGTNVQIATSGGRSLVFDGELTGGVVLDTGELTAERDGDDVHGLVSSSYPRWLPIPAGGDTWTVTPTGGSVTVDVSHRAAWL